MLIHVVLPELEIVCKGSVYLARKLGMGETVESVLKKTEEVNNLKIFI